MSRKANLKFSHGPQWIKISWNLSTKAQNSYPPQGDVRAALFVSETPPEDPPSLEGFSLACGPIRNHNFDTTKQESNAH